MTTSVDGADDSDSCDDDQSSVTCEALDGDIILFDPLIRFSHSL